MDWVAPTQSMQYTWGDFLGVSIVSVTQLLDKSM